MVHKLRFGLGFNQMRDRDRLRSGEQRLAGSGQGTA